MSAVEPSAHRLSPALASFLIAMIAPITALGVLSPFATAIVASLVPTG